VVMREVGGRCMRGAPWAGGGDWVFEGCGAPRRLSGPRRHVIGQLATHAPGPVGNEAGRHVASA